MDDNTIVLQSLIDELILKAATNQLLVTEENVQQALYFLLRSFQAILCEEPNWDYIQIKINAAYNLLTGQIVYPS